MKASENLLGEPLLDAREAAKLLHVPLSTLYEPGSWPPRSRMPGMTGRWRWRSCFGLGALLTVVSTVGVSAALASTANLEFNPPSYNFGGVPYASGPSEPHEFTLTNKTKTQLNIKYWRDRWLAYWPEAEDPFRVTSSICHSFEPEESCSIEVVFEPLHPGPWKGWVRVKSEIEEEPWVELELTGEGTGPWIPVTPNHLVFESVPVGATTAPHTITLEAQGPDGFTIEDISSTPVQGSPLSSNPFQVVGGSCHEGKLLGAGSTCTIEVVMTPTVSGLLQSKLEITDTAPDSPQSVELEGTAIAEPVGQPVNQQTGLVKVARPAVSKLHQSHPRWRRGRRLAKVSSVAARRKRRRPPLGTTFTFRLNEKAKVRFAFARRKGKRFRKAGTLSFAGHRGRNRVRFQGRLSRRKTLPPGRYRLTATAKSGKARSKPRSLRFTIVK